MLLEIVSHICDFMFCSRARQLFPVHIFGDRDVQVLLDSLPSVPNQIHRCLRVGDELVVERPLDESCVDVTADYRAPDPCWLPCVILTFK